MNTKNQKRIFIIGASLLQVPAIKKAKEMGLYVGVADYDPDAIGISLADEYYNVSTIEEKGIFEAASAFGAGGIMTLATDMPMRSLAYACSKLGLAGISYETAIKATDKGEMMKAFKEYGVEHPWFFILNEIDVLQKIKDQITYPCISKPTDNAGSRGVILINNENELIDGICYSSEHGRKGNVIIEEYMQGNEVSVEIIVYNGEPNILAVTDKLTTGAPHFVEMGHSQPSNLSDKVAEKIKDLACRATKAVGIENGPAHVEIMQTEEGPRIIELGARMGGDCIATHLVPLSTGIDMVEATIRLALGEKPDVSQRLSKGAAIRYFDVKQGRIRSITGVETAQTIEGVQEITLIKQVGDIVKSIDSSVDRIGFVIAQGTDANNAIAICEEAMGLIDIEIQEPFS